MCQLFGGDLECHPVRVYVFFPHMFLWVQHSVHQYWLQFVWKTDVLQMTVAENVSRLSLISITRSLSIKTSVSSVGSWELFSFLTTTISNEDPSEVTPAELFTDEEMF